MIKILALVLLLIGLWNAPTHAASDIRSVDFLNFTYHPTLCAREFGKEGIGKSVSIRKGEWSGKEAYYGIVDNKVVYGDLTGDGRDDAVVHIGCGLNGANYGLSELLIFSMHGEEPVIVARLDESNLSQEYLKYYPKGTLWRITDTGVQISKAKLIIENLADGAHCCPESIVTFEYRVDSGKLVPIQKPQKRLIKG